MRLQPDLTVCLDVAPVRSKPAGVGLYVALLATALGKHLGESLALIGRRSDTSALDDVAPSVSSRSFRYGTYHAWMQLGADRDAVSTGAALVHYTNAAAPLRSRLPYVLTVHDLSVARMPRTHPVPRRLILPLNLAAIAGARAIVVPSQFTARELRRIGVSSRRITVIPHAATIPADASPSSEAVSRLGLTRGSYVLYVGTLEPRKNVGALVEAFELMASERPDLRLVLAGAPGWHYRQLSARIERSAVAPRIIRPGYVPRDELAGLLQSCAAFAYVSRYEGFGMPVLDAMAMHAPVVTSNKSAMPEAAGDAAVLVNPDDPADIARGISRAITEREQLVERGTARATSRDWLAVAAEHISLYEFVARDSVA